MKSISSVIFSVGLLVSAVALAQEKQSELSGELIDRWRFGFASTSTFTASDSISAERTFTHSWLQVFGTVPSWEKDFSLRLGLSWKQNISGTLSRGLHCGPLAGFGRSGSDNSIFAGFAAGAHVFIDQFLFVSVDGGPTINSTLSGSVVNFQLKPFGAFLGLSVHFFLD